MDDKEEAQPSGTVTSAPPNTKKRHKPAKTPKVLQFTLKNPESAYLHLRHISQSQASKLDDVTAHLHLTAALSQFLGLHGRAIAIDMMKLDGDDVWIRIPNQDRSAFVAAVSSWVGKDGVAWWVIGWSSWDANAFGRDAGQDLFAD